MNGVKIKFKGVCRHSFWPESGRTMSKRLSIEDVNLLKEMNMNAVRMSHYPPDSHFLDVCDSLGLFVLDELAGWQTNYDTKTGSELAHKMIFHDVNHPSIVIWDNGNEGGWNYDVDHWFEELDPQKRPLIHPWQVFKNTDTQHYKDWDYGNATHQHGHNVTFPTEFLHGLYDGGHGAGLEDFWRQMWQNPLSAGGFLWVYADESVVRTDKNRELDADKNHAPDGIVGPYHEKEGSFFTIKEIWSPIFFEKRFITSHFDGTFNIENRYHYTNINQCHFKWNLVKLPLPGETKQTSVASGKTHSPNIQPNHKGELKIDLPTDFTSADVLYVTATDPHGKEIYTWSWPISLPEKVSGIIVDKTIGEITNFSETDETVTLTAIGTEIEISKKTCQLQNIIANNKSVSLSNGPVFIETIAESDGVKTYREGNNVVVEAITKNKLKQLKWTLYPSGWLRLDVQYFPPYNTTLMGITFSYPEEKIKGMTWMGDGPYRVYKNRLKGTTFNVWDKKYNNTITGESTYGLEYPEFKGFHKNLYWATIDTEEQPFTVVCATENIYLHMLTPDKPQKGETNYAFAEYPKGNISFLHGISPIGTKFRSAEKTGPMGQKNAYTTHGTEYPKDLTLYFNFGEN